RGIFHLRRRDVLMDWQLKQMSSQKPDVGSLELLRLRVGMVPELNDSDAARPQRAGSRMLVGDQDWKEQRADTFFQSLEQQTGMARELLVHEQIIRATPHSNQFVIEAAQQHAREGRYGEVGSNKIELTIADWSARHAAAGQKAAGRCLCRA